MSFREMSLRVGLLSVVALGCAAWAAFDSSFFGSEKSTPLLLEIDPQTLCFGEAFCQKEFAWPIRLVNKSEADLVLAKLATSCGCTRTSLAAPLQIRPGESQEVELVLDLSPRKSDLEKESWRFEATVTPVVRLPNVAETGAFRAVGDFTLHGRVKRFLRDHAPWIDCGQIPQSQIAGAASTIRLETLVPVVDVDLACDETIGSATFHRTDKPLEYNLVFQPATSLDASSFEGAVHLSVRIAGENEPIGVTVPVVGEIVSCVAASPKQLDVGAICAGEVFSRKITMRATESQFDELAIKRFACDHSAITCRILSKKELFVEISPANLGLGQAEVEVIVQNQEGEPSTVRVPISWYCYKQ